MNDDVGGLPALAGLQGEVVTPQNIAVRQVMADGIIAVAAKAKNWPLLHEAVDLKIEDQRAFVAWWDDSVRGAGGDRQSIVSDRETMLSADTAKKQSGISKVQTSRWRTSLQDPDAYHASISEAAMKKAGLLAEDNHRAEGTGDDEWFTPPQYIAAARAVMGGIDLDPATHARAQETVQADAFFTAEDNGLMRDWHGRVWLNPPYAQPLIEQFVVKLAGEVVAGRVSEAIMLTHNYTDTKWFHIGAAHASLICFTRGRIKFTDINGDTCAPTQGQAFFYFGNNLQDFHSVFSEYGFVAQLV